jgi:hypothetical protein
MDGYRWWKALRRFVHSLLLLTDTTVVVPTEPPLELPWQRWWDRLLTGSAGWDFSRGDYQAARRRAKEAARSTLGADLWTTLQQQGYLELPSQIVPGRTYRLRVGRRVEVRDAAGKHRPDDGPFLCVNPRYPLPKLEFFAQLYLYLRDREAAVLDVANPQWYDAPIARTF